MKFTLPISPEYVAHWGLWEAVREIYQNALDEGGATIEYNQDTQELTIASATGQLTPESLVLGTTSKSQHITKRGKFGEGYKLALLVFARLDQPVMIHTGHELWTPQLEHDDTFNATVLNIYTMETIPTEGVRFIIPKVTPGEYDTIKSNIRPNPDESETILDLSEPLEVGRIYVGGLYVATVKGYQCGYSFRPGTVKLDRDRGMIDGFNLAWQTSKLWTTAGHSARLSELLEAEAPDVEYVESHVSKGSSFAGAHYYHYVARHGDYAVPVSNQDEIQRASAAGMKWVLVPEKVKALLRLVKSWVIPNNTAVVERLRSFRAKYQYCLTPGGLHDLDEIIQSLEPRSEHVETCNRG